MYIKLTSKEINIIILSLEAHKDRLKDIKNLKDTDNLINNINKQIDDKPIILKLNKGV